MTIRRSKSALFLVEGDDECFLLGCIKRYGDVRKINLWESQNIIPKETSTRQGVQEIFIIYDTDRLSQIDRFISNVHRLVNTKRLKMKWFMGSH